MNKALATTEQPGELIESVIAKGDIAKLTPEERTRYYVEVCKSVGLNPLTKPFEYITLNGKLTLYARRDATDQLRAIHGVSVTDMKEDEREGVYIVTVKVKNAQGRTDMAKGAVTIGNLRGDALANAMMKAETKAKRRATLSICGLGILDETEVETIQQAPRKSSAQAKRDDEWSAFLVELAECGSSVSVERLREEYRANVYPTWPAAWPDEAEQEFEKRLADFFEPVDDEPEDRFHSLPPVQQAALTCQKPAFWRYLTEHALAGDIEDEEAAAAFVRTFCGVKSRSALKPDSRAAQKWTFLLSTFEGWLNDPAVPPPSQHGAAEQGGGPAVPPEAEPAPDELLRHATEAAKKGTDAYRTFWSNCEPFEQKALQSEHPRLKGIAAEVDQRQELAT